MAKEKRYQILRRREGQDRFSFVAHGAIWSEDQAKEIEQDYSARGDKIRLIRV